MNQTWIKLPPARKGVKCPVSGFCRRKVQNLIYGQPALGIAPAVKFKRVEGGKGGRGTIFVHVPSLMQHMVGEPELSEGTTSAIRGLSASPAWCQNSLRQLLALCHDRAGLTVSEAFAYLLQTTARELAPDDH